MKILKIMLVSSLMVAVWAGSAPGQDWPQWRGPNRDGKATGFKAPGTWPKELTRKWKVSVGRGDGSPAIVGDKAYVFARQDADELVLCFEAATGKELWRATYAAQAASEPMGRHPGPRSSPTVVDGKVLAYGVRGVLSCFDAANGKVLWRKDDAAWPRFFTASSPIIVGGMCVAQLGGEEKGAVAAFDLAGGNEKWKWSEEGTGYASPVVLTVDGSKELVALTAKKIVGLGLADGKLLWEKPFAPPGRAYNAATPIIDGQTVICAGSGRGAKALKIEKNGDAYSATELWSNPDNAVQFNTPVLKNGKLYGISQKGDLFCLNAADGKTLWTSSVGGRDFGSVVDAGPVLLALTPQGELSVFEPNEKEYKKLAGYKVADNEVYAHPVPARKGIYIKDQDSLALWAVE